MLTRKELGKKGETIAANYLKRSGYLIIARNARNGRQEFDLIAKQKEKIVFIEVKTRSQNIDTLLDNPLSTRQQTGLKKSIIAYALKKHLNLEVIRFDLIIVTTNQTQGKASLKHYRDLL